MTQLLSHGDCTYETRPLGSCYIDRQFETIKRGPYSCALLLHKGICLVASCQQVKNKKYPGFTKMIYTENRNILDI